MPCAECPSQESPWYKAFLTHSSPEPESVTSFMQVHNGRKVIVKTAIYELDRTTLWLDFARTYRIGIVIGVGIVAACAYLKSGYMARKFARTKKMFFESHAEESQRSQLSEERLMDGCGNLRKHLVQLDEKESKKTEEKRLLGMNLTDLQTNTINRDDHHYCSSPSALEEPENKEHVDKALMPPPPMAVRAASDTWTRAAPNFDGQRGENTPSADNASRFNAFSYERDESMYSSESTFSKTSTVEINEGSRFTKETNVTAKTFQTRRRRASSFRRMSTGSVMDNW